MLTRQDVGHPIWIPQNWVKDCGPKTKAEDHGVSQTVSPDAAVLVSYRSIVLQIAFFDSPQTELSKDAICNMIEW